MSWYRLYYNRTLFFGNSSSNLGRIVFFSLRNTVCPPNIDIWPRNILFLNKNTQLSHNFLRLGRQLHISGPYVNYEWTMDILHGTKVDISFYAMFRWKCLLYMRFGLGAVHKRRHQSRGRGVCHKMILLNKLI